MHQIRREKRTTISEVIVRVNKIISKIGIGFISNFVSKARVLFNRPVCHLLSVTRVSFCQNLLHFTLGQ